MDLFVVNRYFGDSERRNEISDENSKLAALLSKIEERKKLKEAFQLSTEENLQIGEDADKLDCDNNVPETYKNISSEGTFDKLESEGISNTSKRGSKKKKKKRKWKEISDSEVEEDKQMKEGEKDGGKVDGFTVLGINKFRKKEKVKRVLPRWLANPTIVSVNLQQLTTAVKDIPGLDKGIIRALKCNKIMHFFPVQAQVIPWLLAAQNKPSRYWPQDVCVSAPTGSGKTLAFVIPIVQTLRHRVVTQVRALVVLPVQDLAVQVYHVFLKYITYTDLRVALITGQSSFQKEQQQLVSMSAVSGYRSMVDIIVTTPGRLVDHLQSTPGFTLRYLRFLVIDEADRVIENVQNDWLYHVYSHINTDGSVNCLSPALTISTLESSLSPPPQKLLFSATLTQDPEKLQQLGLFQPKLFTSVVGDKQLEDGAVGIDDMVRGDFVGKYTTPTELSEHVCVVASESKPLVLYHLITSNSWQHVLVFVGSRKDAHRLSLLLKHLGQGRLKVAEISSILSRPAREKILTKFAEGKLDILVSSDALARGMDIQGVDYVILYNAPKSVKNYIHRVGRTGRAGRLGTAVTLLLNSQVVQFNEMLRAAGKNLVQELLVQQFDLEKLEDSYTVALEQLRNDLQKEVEQRLKTEKHNKKWDPLIQKIRDRKRHLITKKKRKKQTILRK